MSLGDRIRAHHVMQAVALTVFLFSLLVWVYVVVIQVTHPAWVDYPFSHITYPPFGWRVDEVGMVALAISAIAFFVYQIERMR